jgi:hypothetical protein
MGAYRHSTDVFLTMESRTELKKRESMDSTREFKETVKARALRDPEFREGLLRESIECMLSGDIATGKIILRDYIEATMWFEDWAT